MNNVFAINGSRFLLIMLIQILMLNNINFTVWGINPYAYVLFILLLPTDTPGWLLLLLAFCTGFIIDLFTDSLGLHSFSSVLTAYFRPHIIQRLSMRDSSDTNTAMDMQSKGLIWFTKYSLFMLFIHHFAYYFLEAFTLSYFFRTLFIVIIGTLFTTIVIIISEFITFKRSR